MSSQWLNVFQSGVDKRFPTMMIQKNSIPVFVSVLLSFRAKTFEDYLCYSLFII